MDLLIDGCIVGLGLGVELGDLGIDDVLRQAQRDVLDFAVLVQTVDAHAVKELQELALVVVKIVEARCNAADESDIGMLHLLDGAQRGHGDGKAAQELRIVRRAVEPLGRNIVILQIVRDDG